MEVIKKLEYVVKAIDDKKGQEIVALDVRGLTSLADYFVITHADNKPQLDAVTNSILEACDKYDISIKNVEGQGSSRWILLDLYDIIIHVFDDEERLNYNLEKMWQDAPLVNISDWVNE